MLNHVRAWLYVDRLSRPVMVLDELPCLYGLKYDSAIACGLPLYLCSYKLVGSMTNILSLCHHLIMRDMSIFIFYSPIFFIILWHTWWRRWINHLYIIFIIIRLDVSNQNILHGLPMMRSYGWSCSRGVFLLLTTWGGGCGASTSCACTTICSWEIWVSSFSTLPFSHHLVAHLMKKVG